MLNFTGSLKVYVATDVADLRKSFTGLWALATNVLKEDPKEGALFVFCNRRRNRVKTLYWDLCGVPGYVELRQKNRAMPVLLTP